MSILREKLQKQQLHKLEYRRRSCNMHLLIAVFVNFGKVKTKSFKTSADASKLEALQEELQKIEQMKCQHAVVQKPECAMLLF